MVLVYHSTGVRASENSRTPSFREEFFRWIGYDPLFTMV